MSTKTEFNPIYTVGGQDFSTYRMYEEGAVAQTFVPGNTVTVNTEGRLQEFAATDNGVLGVPITAGSGTEDTIVPVWLFDHSTIFEATPDTAGDANTVALIVALIAVQTVDIAITSGEHQLNPDATTDDLLMIVGGDPANDKFHVTAGFNCYWPIILEAGWPLSTVVS